MHPDNVTLGRLAGDALPHGEPPTQVDQRTLQRKGQHRAGDGLGLTGGKLGSTLLQGTVGITALAGGAHLEDLATRADIVLLID